MKKLRTEYKFKKFFINYPLLGAFVYFIDLWKTLAFYNILVLNFFNILSFSRDLNDPDMALNNPKFSELLGESGTNRVYSTLGTMQIVFSMIIVISEVFNKIPDHVSKVFVSE